MSNVCNQYQNSFVKTIFLCSIYHLFVCSMTVFIHKVNLSKFVMKWSIFKFLSTFFNKGRTNMHFCHSKYVNTRKEHNIDFLAKIYIIKTLIRVKMDLHWLLWYFLLIWKNSISMKTIPCPMNFFFRFSSNIIHCYIRIWFDCFFMDF